MGDGHDEIDSGFLGNKMGHTNVCVFSNVFVCTRGALGTNPREREIAEEKKGRYRCFALHKLQTFSVLLVRLTERETRLCGP